MNLKVPYVLVFAFLLAVISASCQKHPALQHTTIKLGSNDSIDLDTLNLQLSFPIINKTGRGVGVHFAVSYYGNFWKQSSVPGAAARVADYNYGWNFQPSAVLGSFSETEYEPTLCSLADNYHENLYVHHYGYRLYSDPLGLTHFFGGERQYSECSDSETESYPEWVTADGYTISSGNYIYDVSGARVAVAQISDSNGNFYVSGGQDTTGTVPLTVAGLSGTGITGSSVVYTYKDAYGADQQITVNFGNFDVKSNYTGGQVQSSGSNQKLPTSIVYPDGSYIITYEPTPGYPGSTTARVASVQLPTGGIISYSYGNDAPSAFDGSSSSVTRITSDGTTTFTRTTSNQTSQYDIPQSAHVVVQPSVGNATTYDFNGYTTGWDFSALLYIPTSISDGVTSKTTCYRFMYGDGTCKTYPLSDGSPSPLTGRETTTTFDNAMVQVSKETFDANGMTTISSVSDVAPSSPAMLSYTQTGYETLNNIHDRVGSRTIYDGIGQVSDEHYSYDNPNYSLALTSGLPNREHVFGDRGNLNWVQYNGIEESFWYDDAGQLVQKKDPSGNITEYKHDPTDTFVTETDLPGTGVNPGNIIKASFDAGSGLILSQTDANDHKTTFDYDASLRQRIRTRDSGTGGDGGVVHRDYVSNKQISVTSQNGSGGTADVEEIADDYGRAVRSARKIVSTTGTPWVITDTCYDTNGRVSFTSLPYSAGSLTGSQVCSGAGDSIHYDGIGRTQYITHADGSTVDYVYKGRATQMTEESNGSGRVSKITQVDGLGRITAVCELSTTSVTRGGTTFSPVLCGLDIDAGSPTGFLTTYSYTPSAHTTTVIQNAAAGGGAGPNSQVRTWVTDAFGRPKSEAIPEAYSKQVQGTTGTQGQTTYDYDYNAAGLKVTRTKPRANAVTGNDKTITTTQFDALGRPQFIQYRDQNGVPDADTPDVTFSYDVSTANNAKNVKGRLASVSSAHGSVFYSYTSNGQVRFKASTLPNALCNFTTQTYSYDLLGNLLQASDDAGGSTVVNEYDEAANPKKVSAAVGANAVVPVLQSFQYDAFGLTGVQYGNNWSSSMGYDSRGRMNSFSASYSGSLQYSYSLGWNPNGSLSTANDSINGTWGYTYDEFNRLVKTTQSPNPANPVTTYQYDVFGNRYPLNGGSGGTNPTDFTYDLHNHNSKFAYDQNGNTVSTPQVDSDYDAEGRVIRVRGAGQTTVLAAYVYGPEGDRILATRGSKVTEYFYGIGGDLRLAKVNGVATKAPVNTPVGSVGSFVASGQFQYEFHDWNGSSRLTVNASGSIVKTFQSDAFGAGSNAATDDVAQVNALDVDVDAYSAHAGARDYYPSFGVWNTPDPFHGSYDFGDPQSLNRYAYVGNSPVSYNDPTGLARYDDAPLGSVYSSNGPMYDGYTQAAGVCKSWLCIIRRIPGLLREGGSKIKSFLQNSGGGDDTGDMDRWVQNGLNASPDQHGRSVQTPGREVFTAALLGRAITIDVRTTNHAQDAGIIGAAVALLDHARNLSQTEIRILHYLDRIIVTPSKGRSGADIVAHTFVVRSDYLRSGTLAWLASSIAHDTYHIFQYEARGQVNEEGGAPLLERQADEFQIGVGRKVGLKSYEIDYLKNDRHTSYNTNDY